MDVIARFDHICERLARAAEQAERPARDIRLIAVSKWHTAALVAELARYWAAHTTRLPAGPVFGESYAQEALAKMPEVTALCPGQAVHWHFIGHIQSRKAKDVAGCFDLIHSLDSPKLAHALRKAWIERVAAAPRGLDDAPPPPQPVLIQVNVSGEPQKSGVAPDALEELAVAIAAMPELDLCGLMCLPPNPEYPEQSRPWFAMLRDLRDTLQARLGRPLPELSMGMSGDFEQAIEEGATLVRIGTDIFGSRG